MSAAQEVVLSEEPAQYCIYLCVVSTVLLSLWVSSRTMLYIKYSIDAHVRSGTALFR